MTPGRQQTDPGTDAWKRVCDFASRTFCFFDSTAELRFQLHHTVDTHATYPNMSTTTTTTTTTIPAATTTGTAQGSRRGSTTLRGRGMGSESTLGGVETRDRGEERRREHHEADIVIVGAGVLGCAAAAAFGRQGRSVLLLEKSLKEPDRIVGELLQPGGVRALEELGLRGTSTTHKEPAPG